MAKQTQTRPRKPSTRPNAEATRLQAIIETATLLRDGCTDHDGSFDRWLRKVAQALHVPYLVLRLAFDNVCTNSPDILDLNDFEEGVAFLDAHGISRDLLRMPTPRRIAFEEKRAAAGPR